MGKLHVPSSSDDPIIPISKDKGVNQGILIGYIQQGIFAKMAIRQFYVIYNCKEVEPG